MKRLGAPAPPISLENGLYLASEDVLLAHLRAVADDVPTVLLIGHNDGIGQLAADLAGSGPPEPWPSLREKYPTGALAVLSVPDGPWRDLRRLGQALGLRPPPRSCGDLTARRLSCPSVRGFPVPGPRSG